MNFNVRYCEDVHAQNVTHRIIFNPDYGGQGCDVPGTCILRIRERAIKPKFFEQLEKNVAKDGFRNPIILYNVTEHGLLLSFGGSRLRVAKKLDIPIPAIVVDYTHDYYDLPEVTLDNFAEFFTDVPLHFEFTEHGIDTHYSLERMRRQSYDPGGFAWTENAEDKGFIEEEFPWL